MVAKIAADTEPAFWILELGLRVEG
jgi:hypothetical protein